MSSVQEGEIYIKVDSKGSTTEDKWDDGPGGQVNQICIWHGPLVYGIQITYVRDGSAFLSPRHGGTEGDFEVVSFNEPLTWISGHYGSWCLDPDEFLADEEDSPWLFCTVIRSLKFGTDRQSYGPFGRECGIPFSFKMSTGCAGLHGRATQSSYLNAIGVYVRGMANRVVNEIPLPPIVTAPTPKPMLEASCESENKKSLEM